MRLSKTKRLLRNREELADNKNRIKALEGVVAEGWEYAEKMVANLRHLEQAVCAPGLFSDVTWVAGGTSHRVLDPVKIQQIVETNRRLNRDNQRLVREVAAGEELARRVKGYTVLADTPIGVLDDALDEYEEEGPQ